MARRNRVNQGPLVVVMLVVLAAWLFWESGATSLFSPAGMLLLLALVLVLNSFLRKKTRPKSTDKPAVTASYGYVPRHPKQNRRNQDRQPFSRTRRTTKPETWPYDGSYCVHCGFKKTGEDSICRRCHQPIDYSA